MLHINVDICNLAGNMHTELHSYILPIRRLIYWLPCTTSPIIFLTLSLTFLVYLRRHRPIYDCKVLAHLHIKRLIVLHESIKPNKLKRKTTARCNQIASNKNLIDFERLRREINDDEQKKPRHFYLWDFLSKWSWTRDIFRYSIVSNKKKWDDSNYV